MRLLFVIVVTAVSLSACDLFSSENVIDGQVEGSGRYSFNGSVERGPASASVMFNEVSNLWTISLYPTSDETGGRSLTLSIPETPSEGATVSHVFGSDPSWSSEVRDDELTPDNGQSAALFTDVAITFTEASFTDVDIDGKLVVDQKVRGTFSGTVNATLAGSPAGMNTTSVEGEFNSWRRKLKDNPGTGGGSGSGGGTGSGGGAGSGGGSGTACTNEFTISSLVSRDLAMEQIPPAPNMGAPIPATVQVTRDSAPSGVVQITLASKEMADGQPHWFLRLQVPKADFTPGKVDIIDDQDVVGVEQGFAIFTYAAYESFYSNKDWGRNKDMGDVELFSTTPQVRGRFSFHAIADGYPSLNPGEVRVSGTFCTQ